ncbi:required for drug-induced death protein 1 [Clarias gariepinus]|uniref:required for drug-induced death protein 1 n=1 Tax=Clarias gariepinus TaxID=13013 RepID=UPI00234D31AF|nr:required for drug-induced death protein 1 [Clarias gariepinus]XP_053366255.1 required for drug-induced death protein 1 [Clarias gariepinus]
MSRRKLRKFKQKRKSKNEDKLKTISGVKEECVVEKCEEFTPERSVCERQRQSQSSGRKKKSSKQVHFAVLPDKYEPLEEDRASDTETEDNNSGKERKYKSFRKNFGKAIRYTWKCLVVGLQTFSTSYSGPLSAASTLVPDIQRTRPRA